MKNLVKISLIAALCLVTSASAGDDTNTGTVDSSGLNAKGVSLSINPVNAGAANISDGFAKKRFGEKDVNDQLNVTQEVFNAVLVNVDDLYFKQSNASSWSLDSKGLGEIVKVAGNVNKKMKDIIDLAMEKDPTVAAQLVEALNAKGLTNLATDIKRLYNLHGISGISFHEISLANEDTGFLYTKINGVKYNCTTEGYMTKTPANESWVACVTANAGSINNGVNQLTNVAYGSFLPGDTKVIVQTFPYSLTDPKYVLDMFNISSTNPKTAKYFNGIMFGGEHVNSKVYGNSATATDTKVLSTNLPPVKMVVSKPIILDVRVVNTDKEAVPAKVID